MHLRQIEDSMCGVYSYIRLFCVNNLVIPFKSAASSERTQPNICLHHFNTLYALTVII